MTQKDLVPITRDYLRAFYAKIPLPPIPPEIEDHQQKVTSLTQKLLKPGSKVQETVGMPSPTRIDDCFWRNRMLCEELALSFSKLQQAAAKRGSGSQHICEACERCNLELLAAEKAVRTVQESNTASVKQQLQQFVPQDFRGAILEHTRESKERAFKSQIDALVKKGGTVRQKYDLYLQQQWERRQALVQLGECSGMYKFLVKYLAGIPQVLLDFAKEINAKLGPMEEQRLKYGPDLYVVTTLGFALDVCLAAWLEALGSPAGDAALQEGAMKAVVEPAVHFYVHHMLRVISFIGEVFQVSPFFLTKDDLAHPERISGDGTAAGTVPHKGGSFTNSSSRRISHSGDAVAGSLAMAVAGPLPSGSSPPHSVRGGSPEKAHASHASPGGAAASGSPPPPPPPLDSMARTVVSATGPAMNPALASALNEPRSGLSVSSSGRVNNLSAAAAALGGPSLSTTSGRQCAASSNPPLSSAFNEPMPRSSLSVSSSGRYAHGPGSARGAGGVPHSPSLNHNSSPGPGHYAPGSSPLAAVPDTASSPRQQGHSAAGDPAALPTLGSVGRLSSDRHGSARQHSLRAESHASFTSADDGAPWQVDSTPEQILEEPEREDASTDSMGAAAAAALAAGAKAAAANGGAC